MDLFGYSFNCKKLSVFSGSYDVERPTFVADPINTSLFKAIPCGWRKVTKIGGPSVSTKIKQPHAPIRKSTRIGKHASARFRKSSKIGRLLPTIIVPSFSRKIGNLVAMKPGKSFLTKRKKASMKKGISCSEHVDLTKENADVFSVTSMQRKQGR